MPKQAGPELLDAATVSSVLLGSVESPLPLARPCMPQKPRSRSGRLRQRHRGKRQIWRAMVAQTSFVNGLHSGDFITHDRPRNSQLSDATSRAQKLAAEEIRMLSTQLVRDRRCFYMSGGRHPLPRSGTTRFNSELQSLVKNLTFDASSYARKQRGPCQVPLIANDVIEPAHSECVSMLDALPAGEAAYYGEEGNVIDWSGKSQVILDELHSQYAFYGGSFEQVLKYFHRTDLPERLWQWRLFSNVKAVAGMSTVLKKDGISQRKLLMAVPFNYLVEDVKLRSNLGMNGGRRFQGFIVIKMAGKQPAAISPMLSRPC